MDLDHPAETRPAATLAERAAKVRLMRKEHVRTTLEQARDIGHELRAAKEQCVREGKPWLPWLEQARTDRTTASRYMRIAEHWSLLVDYDALVHHGGVAEALNHIAGAIKDEEEIGARPRPPGPALPPVKPAKLCPGCERKGYRINCEDCKRLNTPGKKPPSPQPPPTDRPREAGDDDGEADAAYAKYEAERLKHVSGPLVREIRKIGQTYGLQVPPPKQRFAPMQPFREWFDGFDPRFKPVMRQLWDARKSLAELLLELEKERSGKGAEDVPIHE